jgi:hypothetical protein
MAFRAIFHRPHNEDIRELLIDNTFFLLCNCYHVTSTLHLVFDLRKANHIFIFNKSTTSRTPQTLAVSGFEGLSIFKQPKFLFVFYSPRADV